MPEFELIERNLRQSMSGYALATPDGTTRTLPGLQVASSGLPIGVFNSAMLTEPVTGPARELEARIGLARVFFDSLGMPWSFWLCEELLPSAWRRRAASLFHRQGFELVSEPVGMIADALLPPTRRLPPLLVRHVACDGAQLDFCAVTSEVFHLPVETSRQLYGRPEMWHQGFAGFVGYRDGQPVATTAVVRDGHSLGLYSVGTVPAQRQRGFAEAIVRQAVATADAPEMPLVLQATRAGLSLYEHLGFRVASRFAVYLRE